MATGLTESTGRTTSNWIGTLTRLLAASGDRNTTVSLYVPITRPTGFSVTTALSGGGAPPAALESDTHVRFVVAVQVIVPPVVLVTVSVSVCGRVDPTFAES